MDSGSSAPRNVASQLRTMSHYRKRAVTACEPCRARKIKCTNERPVCQSCIRQGTQCSYEQRSNHSSFDPASLLILDKLNQVLSKLEVNQNEPSTSSVPISGPPSSLPASVPTQDEAYFSSSFSSTDSVLSWPIFQPELGQINLGRELLLADHQKTREFDKDPYASPEDAYIHRTSICEEEIPKYIEQFIHFVHTKNPILDTNLLKRYASNVAENGLRWDAVSCLVLVACALGAIAVPFEVSGPGSQHPPEGACSLSGNSSTRITAETFYQLARRRLGLLSRGIIACQCQLLCGIYLMYTMRPLEAWRNFYNASVTCALYLKGRDIFQKNTQDTDEEEAFSNQSHQRLYWTCIKSESELRTQLNLPVSELAMYHIPDILPSPPTFSSISGQIDNVADFTGSSPMTTSSTQTSQNHLSTQQVEEQSWFYYLSELALIRIESRVSSTFYKNDNCSWLQFDTREMVASAENFELQLQNWVSMLPATVGFQSLSSRESINELQYALHGRYVMAKELIYRPFLYLIAHSKDIIGSDLQQVKSLAEKGLQLLMSVTDIGPGYHRHHGTWIACRGYTSGALMLYAGIKAGLIQGNILHEAKRNFSLCHITLKYWEAECPELLRARQIVELIQSKV